MFHVKRFPFRIRAELIGDNRCEAEGISVTAPAPVLALCRKLIAAGFHHKCKLDAYRGEVLCLRVSSLAAGAKLTVWEGSSAPRFRAFKDRPPPEVIQRTSDRTATRRDPFHGD